MYNTIFYLYNLQCMFLFIIIGALFYNLNTTRCIPAMHILYVLLYIYHLIVNA